MLMMRNWTRCILGIVGLCPMVLSFLEGQLPSARLRELDETLSDTSSLFRSVTEEGLLTNTTFLIQTESGLAEMHWRAGELRAKTHTATTTIKEFKALMNGLSHKISLLSAEVKDLRAAISTTSAKERDKLLGRQVPPNNDTTLPLGCEIGTRLSTGHSVHALSHIITSQPVQDSLFLAFRILRLLLPNIHILIIILLRDMSCAYLWMLRIHCRMMEIAMINLTGRS
ncbi:hypothetical protein A0H81_10165 [Grifola frondosa]|uniref:Uncharacterized protein n=1 Tax=Grifola frondosa TaxID=5627 RepID=A0A1C7LXT8_GRIFR|nr:hypothetical protein A0H81_10165 [Grifola frondosa]